MIMPKPRTYMVSRLVGRQLKRSSLDRELQQCKALRRQLDQRLSATAQLLKSHLKGNLRDMENLPWQSICLIERLHQKLGLICRRGSAGAA